ncbi:hypothetical protein EDD18DRAFT_1100507 [Armillaria luteobubalina]|uniref:Uncharacterized protein n=1 Tax=Armillaria luteobubalina TaxID=153913 RepID=A0AA39QFK5_9AGAR|nr:hypothetical protein EDD18DRAFT_1100507 [Armillaria luteobubalina]
MQSTCSNAVSSNTVTLPHLNSSTRIHSVPDRFTSVDSLGQLRKKYFGTQKKSNEQQVALLERATCSKVQKRGDLWAWLRISLEKGYVLPLSGFREVFWIVGLSETYSKATYVSSRESSSEGCLPSIFLIMYVEKGCPGTLSLSPPSRAHLWKPPMDDCVVSASQVVQDAVRVFRRGLQYIGRQLSSYSRRMNACDMRHADIDVQAPTNMHGLRESAGENECWACAAEGGTRKRREINTSMGWAIISAGAVEGGLFLAEAKWKRGGWAGVADGGHVWMTVEGWAVDGGGWRTGLRVTL